MMNNAPSDTGDYAELVERLRELKLAFDNANSANNEAAWEAARTQLVAWFAIEGGERALITAITAQAAEIAALRETLGELEKAEATYRYAHDILGAGDSKTGRAWDLMRRAGEKARALLSTPEPSKPADEGEG